MIVMKVNGVRQEVDVDPNTPLLWVIREQLELTGTKFGCGMAQCGACTVQLNGVAIRTCTTPVAAAAGQEITTIEGLAPSQEELHPLQSAWIEHQVPQCGYCQPGMIMATRALLDRTPQPTDADIDKAITNLCRCGSYPRIRRAIHRAAKASSDARDLGKEDVS